MPGLLPKIKICKLSQEDLIRNISKKFIQQQNDILIKQINQNKIKQAIFQMENSKSPGIDGIPIEFYKQFYEYIKHDLLQLYENILFIEKQTPKIMNRAIITLIPPKKQIQIIQV